MFTRAVMMASALGMAAAGVSLLFLPQEIQACFHTSPTAILALVLQLMGALYFAAAATNWMAKGSLVGGIYNRPIVIGNLAHFFSGAAILLKVAFSTTSVAILCLSILYLIFALCFAHLLFRHPVPQQK
ncbi:hypothetical protein [uncultured Pontibacter sp.]|uniref:hypothetical protein n=1 Tax=uncultured Pontibacter sp. TaxID=453356 RepID=UPI00262496A0|nr:hypothetical protein [uncultured Pontibacter sp.]